MPCTTQLSQHLQSQEKIISSLSKQTGYWLGILKINTVAGWFILVSVSKFPIFMNDSQHMYLILIIDGFILTQCSASYLKPKAVLVSYLGKALYTTDTPPCSPTGSRSVGRWSGGCTS